MSPTPTNDDDIFKQNNRFKYYPLFYQNETLRGEGYDAFVRRVETRRAQLVREYAAKKAAMADFSEDGARRQTFSEFMNAVRRREDKKQYDFPGEDDSNVKGDTPLFSFEIKLAFYNELVMHLKAASANTGISIGELKTDILDKFKHFDVLFELLGKSMSDRDIERFDKSFPAEDTGNPADSRHIELLDTIPWSHFYQEATLVSRDLEEALALQNGEMQGRIMRELPSHISSFGATPEFRAEKAAYKYLRELRWREDCPGPALTPFDDARLAETKNQFKARMAQLLGFVAEEDKEKPLSLSQKQGIRLRDASLNMLRIVNGDYRLVPPESLRSKGV